MKCKVCGGHVYPLVHTSSGDVYCCKCLAVERPDVVAGIQRCFQDYGGNTDPAARASYIAQKMRE